MSPDRLPKIELHLHLDCCLSYAVVQRLKPGTTYEEYRDHCIAPPKCHDLADYIARAIYQVNLMQTAEALRLVTLDLFEQLKADNVIYAELRFAPLQHLAGGLSPETVVEVVNAATEEGIRTTGVEARLILCTLRHYDAEQSMRTVRLVNTYRGTKVVGFDIAANEAGFPIDAHLDAFAYARENKLHITAHAGEACGAESVWETLEHFGPSRIGHGVRSVEDDRLMEELRRRRIHLEVCPTSNVQTDAVDRLEVHPVDQLYRRGISTSISTDGRTISDVTLAEEYHKLQQQFGWTAEEFTACNLEAIEHAFLEEAAKDKLRRRIRAVFA